jgi:hypothetical protein
MIDAIKKVFNKATAEKEVMSKEEVQTDLAAPEMAAKLASTLEALATQAEALQALTSQLTEMSSLYEAAQAALTAADVAKELLVAEAKEKRLAARKETIVASVGTAKADALLAATEALDDVAFNAVVGALSVSFEDEAKTVQFKEVGVSAVADPVKVAEAGSADSEESKILKAKYKKSK